MDTTDIEIETKQTFLINDSSSCFRLESTIVHRGEISFTHLPLVLLLVLLTESELEERLRDADPLWERAGRVAWLASL